MSKAIVIIAAVAAIYGSFGFVAVDSVKAAAATKHAQLADY